ncbi:hypothetical protein AVEN_63501-1 [Araneus ventricosus]|uniref:Uncharacterized protein n=1 Tax=Araneus ventricosus TaxID=182803 RepID=A0A4Y2NEZ0_ARAVE|nr:hypothetical protein AVEN_63501-1 [Araneus ventricosus]
MLLTGNTGPLRVNKNFFVGRKDLRKGAVGQRRDTKPVGEVSPKLSRILSQKGAVFPPPAWIKKFEPTVTQNPMTIRRFFIIVIEKYLGKEFKEMRTD